MTKRVIYSNVMRLYIPDNKVSSGRTDISVEGLVLGEVLDSDWWRHTLSYLSAVEYIVTWKGLRWLPWKDTRNYRNVLHENRKQKKKEWYWYMLYTHAYSRLKSPTGNTIGFIVHGIRAKIVEWVAKEKVHRCEDEKRKCEVG